VSDEVLSARYVLEYTYTRSVGPVIGAFLEGLREAGWQGDARGARFAYAATSPLTYSIGYLFVIDSLLDVGWQAQSEQTWGRSAEEVLDWWASRIRFSLELADEARGLLGSLDEI